MFLASPPPLLTEGGGGGQKRVSRPKVEKLGILQNVICYCGGTAGAYIHDKPPTWGINLHSEKDFVIHGVCDCKATYWTGLAPAYMKDLLKSYLPARDLRSSKKNLLAMPVFLIKTVMAAVLFLLLCCYFGRVFLSILGMLDHWTFLKDNENCSF